MGRPGRPKKEDHELAAPRKVDKPSIVLPPWDGKTRGPTLGRLNPEGYEWHKLTLKWWRTWRQSPQAMFCEPTDWEGLFLGAVIHDKIMKGVSHTNLANLSSELRRREGSVGASVEDRVRLGMSQEKPKNAIEDALVDRGVREVIDYAERVARKVRANDTP